MQKIIKIILPLIFVSGALLSSCSKKKDDPAPAPAPTSNTNNTNTNTNDNNTNTNDSNTNTNPNTTVASGDYFPLIAGNIWNYAGDNNLTYTTAVTSKTKKINGIVYNSLTQGDPANPKPDTVYAYRDGNKYYSYNPITEVGPLEIKLIDLDLPIGASWTAATIKSNESTIVTYTMKVTGTGLSRTVNNIAYNDVISVQLLTTAAMDPAHKQYLINIGMDPSIIALAEAQYGSFGFSQIAYYAKNKGMIEQTSVTKGLNVHLVSSVVK